MNYENGLKILEAFVRLEDTDTLDEFDLYQSRLRRYLNKEKLFGSNSSLEFDIAEVIYSLNPLARRLTDMSFADLCVDTYQLDEMLLKLLRKIEANKIRYIVASIVHNEISPNPDFLEQLATRYQIPLPTDFGDKIDIGPAIAWQGPDDELELQSFLKPNPDMMEVSFLKRAVERTASVCKIELAHLNRTGTGFLIAPTLVLTNYHLLGHNDEEVKNNAPNVVLRFGYITEESDNEQTFHLVAKQPILDKSQVANGLDYVLLQVDDKINKIKEIQPVPYELTPPTKGMAIHILQHPQGDTMKLAINDNGITGIHSTTGFIQYVTRTQGGSSGAPCFNEDWKVVALHHAQRAKSFGTIREGILFSAIYEEIKKYL
jgi:endonuclease G, mitochondrial